LINAFRPDGTFIRTIGSAASGGKLAYPLDISVQGENLYVVDSGSTLGVQCYHVLGAFLRETTKAGDSDWRVAVSNTDSVNVVIGGREMQRYNGAGAWQLTTGLKLGTVTDVETDPAGYIYIAELSNPTDRNPYVWKYKDDGANVLRVDMSLDGAKRATPTDIAVDAYGRVYVWDKTTKSLHRFAQATPP
jgi:DNA-binding beta-propeller fold protein YncE